MSVSASETVSPRADAVLTYWFGADYQAWKHTEFDASLMQKWFEGSPEVDAEVTSLFGNDISNVASGKYDAWLTNKPYDTLAAIILMDQFTRNAFRGTAKMYSLDDRCLLWAKALAESKEGASLHPLQYFFCTLPFMHSEDISDQKVCVALLEEKAAQVAAEFGEDVATVKALKRCADFGRRHEVIIEKWGRFPHRNAILGRESTQEEAAGLADGSISSF